MEVDPSKDRRVLFYGETMKKAVLFVISAYQLVRFLSFALLFGFTEAEGGGSWGLVLALSAAGLVTPLLFFRLATAPREVAAVLREITLTTKLLETTGAALLVGGTLPGVVVAFTPEAMLLPAIASIIVVVDALVLFIVLLFRR